MKLFSAPTNWPWPLWLALAVAAMLYAVNLGNGLFWDDNDWIVNNVSVHGLNWDYLKFWFTNNTLAGIGLTSNYYRPFLFFTFAVNYVIGGTAPVGYHLVSNLLHLANGLLLFLLLNSGLRRTGRFSWVALLTALTFLIHPVQTEAVSYISGRGDPLSVFFMLLALWLYLGVQPKQADLPRTKQDAEQVRGFVWGWRRWGSLVALSLALLSRETAIIFPGLLLIWQLAFGPALPFWRSLGQALKKSWPHLAVVLVYGVLRLTALNFENTLNFYTVQNVYSEHLSVRLFTFFNSLWLYLKLLFLPVGLHMERAMPVFTSFWLWPVWPMALALLALLGWLSYLYRRERRFILRTKTPLSGAVVPVSDFRLWLFGAGWFFIALAPVSGITPINALFYEHWLYLPLVGFFTIVFSYGERLWRWLTPHLGSSRPSGGPARWRQNLGHWLLVAALIAYLAFLGAQTVRRNRLWGQPIAFFENILRYEAGSARVLNNLGNIYYDQNDVIKAADYYAQAIAVGDIFPQPHFNLGAIRQSQGDWQAAVRHYEAALRLDPNFYYPYPNLIELYVGRRDFRGALGYAEKLRALRPDDPRVYYNLAQIQLALGDRTGARASIEQGLARSQYDAEAKRLLENLAENL